MSFRRRTYEEIRDNLLTDLTGGVASESHPAPTGDAPEVHLEVGEPVDIVSVYGSAGGSPAQFKAGVDFKQGADARSLVWRSEGVRPDEGTLISVNYRVRSARPDLTDIYTGSVVRTLLESMGLELARVDAQLDAVYRAGFIDTASGSALDNVVALLGVKRIQGGHPIGDIQFTRSKGGTGQITLPAGTRVMTEDGSVEYETTAGVTMAEGQSIIRVPARDIERNDPLEANTLVVLPVLIGGIATVTNPNATAIATREETDDQLRVRAKSILHASERATIRSILGAIERQGVGADVIEALDEFGQLRVTVTLHDAETLTPELQHRVLRAIEDTRPAGVRVHFAGTRQVRKVDLTIHLTTAPDLLDAERRGAHDQLRSSLSDYLSGLPTQNDASLTVLAGSALSIPGVQDMQIADASWSIDGVRQDILDLASGKLRTAGEPTAIGELRILDPNLATGLAFVVRHGQDVDSPDEAAIGDALTLLCAALTDHAAAESDDSARSLTFDKLAFVTPLPDKASGTLGEFEAAVEGGAPPAVDLGPYTIEAVVTPAGGAAHQIAGPDAPGLRAGARRASGAAIRRVTGWRVAVTTLQRIADHLPLLYRPDLADDDLPIRLVRGVADEIDRIVEGASAVLSAHWFNHADRRGSLAYFQRADALIGRVPPKPGDAFVFVDPAALVDRLRNDQDALTAFIREALDAASRSLLASHDPAAPPTPTLQRALMADLAELIKGDLIHDDERFDGVTLSDALQERLDVTMTDAERIEVNRRLLIEAFNGVLAPPTSEHPFVHDLVRMASILGISPLEGEGTEAFRRRVARIVRLYREGIGTRLSLERMIEAHLPVRFAAAQSQQERPFWIEEQGARSKQAHAQGPSAVIRGATVRAQAAARGEPIDLLGPLMPVYLHNTGVKDAAPTLYIQGIEPDEPRLAPTVNPALELEVTESTTPRLAIGFRGALAPTSTLRLRPTHTRWIGNAEGILAATSSPTDDAPADATGSDEHEPPPGAPTALVKALAQTRDGHLWAGVNDDDSAEIWRFDGADWQLMAELDAPVTCFAAHADVLLAGTTEGLLSVDLFPEGDTFEPSPVAALSDAAIHALRTTPAGTCLVCTDAGLVQLDRELGVIDQQLETIAVFDVCPDALGNMLLATDAGLLKSSHSGGTWHVYVGADRTDQILDWHELPATEGLADALVDIDPFLPPVLSIHAQQNGDLWLGTTHGIARYRARPVRPLSYETILEAYPELTEGPVLTIRRDERGRLWFLTDRGVLRFDGRGWSQQRGDAWVALGRLDDGERGAWRFDGSTERWQRHKQLTNVWQPHLDDERVTTAEPPVLALAWTDGVVADIGSWDGTTFQHEQPVAQAQLEMRVKLTDVRIVSGGIPSVPRAPVGRSRWRYLSLEDPLVTTEDPKLAWTSEGRLLPPATEHDLPGPGRFDIGSPEPAIEYDDAVFAFAPAARVWFEWSAGQARVVIAHLGRRFKQEPIDPGLIDQVWRSMQLVRPAGVRTLLAIEDVIVRGE